MRSGETTADRTSDVLSSNVEPAPTRRLPVPRATYTVTPPPPATATPQQVEAPTVGSTAEPAPSEDGGGPPSSEAPAVVRGGTFLPLPEGVQVVWGGCASDGTCYQYNFYWAPTHEVVLQHGEGQIKVQHELCHAHQHWTINGGAPLRPSDYDLASWYGTAEGQSFASATAGLGWPWTHSAVSGLEDFAWTCAHWYLDPAYLASTSPERYAWAAANLP